MYNIKGKKILNGSEGVPQLLKSNMAILLHFQLCSTRYTVLQMKNSMEVSLQSIHSLWKFRTILFSVKKAIILLLKGKFQA